MRLFSLGTLTLPISHLLGSTRVSFHLISIIPFSLLVAASPHFIPLSDPQILLSYQLPDSQSKLPVA